MVTRTWIVFGEREHRLKESFNKSKDYDWSNDKQGVRKIHISNADETGTNLYSIVFITRDTNELCEKEMMGQLSDGIFENCRFGAVQELNI